MIGRRTQEQSRFTSTRTGSSDGGLEDPEVIMYQSLWAGVEIFSKADSEIYWDFKRSVVVEPTNEDAQTQFKYSPLWADELVERLRGCGGKIWAMFWNCKNTLIVFILFDTLRKYNIMWGNFDNIYIAQQQSSMQYILYDVNLKNIKMSGA